MTLTRPTSITRSILDDLHESLERVLTGLNQKWTDTPLSLKPSGPTTIENERRSFVLEGPDDLSIDVKMAALPVDADTVEVQIEVDDAPVHRFTCDVDAGNDVRPADRDELERKVAAMLRREIEPRIGQHPGPSSEDTTEYVPQIDLNRNGSIERLNDAARSALEYETDDTIERNFFAHVDGHNLRRVMRDLAQMVTEGMQRARWLVRLQTGNNRWRWFRVFSRNRLRSKGVIRLHLRPLDRF